MWETNIYLSEAIEMLKRLDKKNTQNREWERQSSAKQLDMFLKSDDWKVLFKLGCVLPHAVAFAEKNVGQREQIRERAHFYTEYKSFGINITADLFLKKYTPCIYRPLELGYYFHLKMDEAGRDIFLKRNFRFVSHKGKHTHILRNELLQYIPGLENQTREVFIEKRILDIISEEFCCDQEILKELDRLRNWLLNDFHCLDCIIQEIEGEPLKELLLEEINRCREKISASMIEGVSILSEFKQKLQKDMKDFFSEFLHEFTDGAILNLNRSGWIEEKNRCWFARVKALLCKPVSHFRRNGILGCNNFIKNKILKFILQLLHGDKQREETVQDKIFNTWKKQWTSDYHENEQDFFLYTFVENYAFVKKKIKKNKKKNFLYKQLFLSSLLLVVVFVLGYTLHALLLEKEKGISWSQIILIWGSIGGSFALLSAIIAKWLDIKKYQETWIRHSTHKYKLDREMLLYVHQLAPYNKENRKFRFVEKVVEIWDENQIKFMENMENKEKTIIDILPQFNKYISVPKDDVV